MLGIPGLIFPSSFLFCPFFAVFLSWCCRPLFRWCWRSSSALSRTMCGTGGSGWRSRRTPGTKRRTGQKIRNAETRNEKTQVSLDKPVTCYHYYYVCFCPPTIYSVGAVPVYPSIKLPRYQVFITIHEKIQQTPKLEKLRNKKRKTRKFKLQKIPNSGTQNEETKNSEGN